MGALYGGKSRGELGETFLRSRSFQVESVSLSGFLDGDRYPRATWATPSGDALCGFGRALGFEVRGHGRFERAREAAEKLFDRVESRGVAEPARPRLFGGFSFHDSESDWREFPSGFFFLPEVQLAKTGRGCWVTVNAVGGDVGTVPPVRGPEDDTGDLEAPGVERVKLCESRKSWKRKVSSVLRRIESGELSKAVLAQSIHVEIEGGIDLPRIVVGMREANRGSTVFLFQPSEETGFFGATPEKLVELRGNSVETEALAGSAPRGKDTSEDEELSYRMERSEKERREHRLVVDYLVDRLDEFSDTLVRGDMGVKRLSDIQHFYTPLAGEVHEGTHVLSLLGSLHPTPAVCGMPQKEASRVVREMEDFDRGWYAGPVGWMDERGDGSFGVAIRSGRVSDGGVQLFAGAGLVEGSDPDSEWEEVQLKYRPVLQQLGKD